MPKTKAQKIEKVADLTLKLGKAKSVVFADYQGLTMNQLSDLRNKLRDAGAEFEVTKNTLLGITIENLKLKIENSQFLEGPTATLFSYEDEIAPIKILVKAFKDAQKGAVKLGLLDMNVLDAVTVTRLANLPTKLELQAKLVGSISSPLYGIVNVLQGNLRGLVCALNQYKMQREVTQ
ncbi:MAG: 50S ribosomal protein L10 [Candidatus Daviesbacteria bacterium]|nr:50S ribosomal protein L10 [Candidatus Daviesbacteria bacterium]